MGARDEDRSRAIQRMYTAYVYRNTSIEDVKAREIIRGELVSTVPSYGLGTQPIDLWAEGLKPATDYSTGCFSLVT